MNLFEEQYHQAKKMLEYESHSSILKKVIDWTLDTEDISFYKEMGCLLDEMDDKSADENILKEHLHAFIEKLHSRLSEKGHKQPEKLLDVKNLIKAYKSSSFALGPIGFDISEGQIIGLVGENGNGKTTLLRSLCRELEPTSGNIHYLFPFKDSYDLRSKLIYIPQRTKSWHGSLLDNLQFTASSYGILGEENRLLVQLVIARMGLREYRHLKWKELSSGYKMRFELARMLLRKPKLLLIDEPLANLDIIAQQTVLEDFMNIAKSPFRPLGIVLSSQQLYEVEKTSDKVIFLKKGLPQDFSQNEGAALFKEVAKFIIEFESEFSPEKLQKALGTLNLEKLQLTGGTYIAIFPEETTQKQFFNTVAEQEIPLNYYRNISNSTRRFFM